MSCSFLFKNCAPDFHEKIIPKFSEFPKMILFNVYIYDLFPDPSVNSATCTQTPTLADRSKISKIAAPGSGPGHLVASTLAIRSTLKTTAAQRYQFYIQLVHKALLHSDLKFEWQPINNCLFTVHNTWAK